MRTSYRMLSVFLMLLLTGCTAAQPETEVNVPAEPAAELTAAEPEETAEPETAAPETLPETAPATAAPSEQEIPYEGEQHVFDACGVLDSAELAHYNEYLDNLADSRLICTAVVITGNLEGASPEMSAQEQYQQLFGKESGFLLLINNDTGKDVFYRSGACAAYITDTALPIAQATPHLVEGDFAGALDILLPLGERMPEYIFDRSDALTTEQVQSLAEMAQSVSGRCCVLLTDEAPRPEEEKTPEQALADDAEAIRSRLDAKMLLVMDVKGNQCVIAGAPPEQLATEVQAVWKEQGLYSALTSYYDSLG